MDDEFELLDLVDENDKVIGSIERTNVKKLFNVSGKYVRYAECFIQNSEGKLWVPRRQANKRIAPSGLDFSASEHVQAGEDYLTAITRGLEEELNLKVKASDLKHVGRLTPIHGRPFFCDIYLLEQNEVPSYNKLDFSGYKWLSPEELIALLEQGEVAKLDLEDAARLLIE